MLVKHHPISWRYCCSLLLVVNNLLVNAITIAFVLIDVIDVIGDAYFNVFSSIVQE